MTDKQNLHPIPPEEIEGLTETIVQGMLEVVANQGGDAPPGTVTHAIREGEITTDEIHAIVRDRLQKFAKEPS